MAAEGDFAVSGTTLTLTLKNTAATASTAQSEILAGVLFDLPAGIGLTPSSTTATLDGFATAAATDLLLQSQGPCDVVATCDGDAVAAGLQIGGEATYSASIAGHDSGVGMNGQFGGQLAGTTNLDKVGSPDGSNFGIVPGAGNNISSGEGSSVPLIKNQIVFTFTITGGTLSEGDISNVLFVYGTAFNEGNITGQTGDVTTETTVTTSRGPVDSNGDVGVPEPASLLLLGSGLVGAATRLRRRRS